MAPTTLTLPALTSSRVAALFMNRSRMLIQTFSSMARGIISSPFAWGYFSMVCLTAGSILSTSGGIFFSTAWSCPLIARVTAVTAPHCVWPSTTITGVRTCARPYSMDPTSSVSHTLPATRITKISITPASKIASTGTRESEQVRIVA